MAAIARAPQVRRSARRRGRGLSLVEVLVSLLIFSVGLVGLIGLQSRALRYSTAAEDTNRAALLANEIAAQMLTTQNIVLTAAQIETWNARVGDAAASGLPNGTGVVEVDPVTRLATITIEWRAVNVSANTPNAKNRYVTQVMVVS